MSTVSSDWKTWPAQRIFEARLKREKKYEAYQRRIAELTGGGEEQSVPVAMEEFGFLNLTDEQARYQHAQRQEKPPRQPHATAKQKRELYESLPEDAEHLPPDIKWIFMHSAMYRSPKTNRKTGKPGKITITARDLEGAPSKGAANMLAYYVNNRDEFFKKVLDLEFKGAIERVKEQVGERLSDSDRQLDDIRKLIQQAVA